MSFVPRTVLLVLLLALWSQSRAATAEQHWAYVPPQRPALPSVAQADWTRSPLDHFVLASLEERQLHPAPQADRAVLVRRVYLDLLGIPPTVEQVDAFLSDTRADAWERLVDQLLSSPRYGERWARPWLDLARYADSNGYQADQYRSVWPYRDWVIDAMNTDLPFDEFTLYQIAGDLLEGASAEHKVATGFHRLTTCNVEAGVDPEENRVEQVVDRVNTTGTVWLGTTVECAQCHAHKYDPLSQEEYYRLFAYFNNTPLEVEGNGITYNFIGPKMALPAPGDEQEQLQALERRLKRLNSRLAKLKPSEAEAGAAATGEEVSTNEEAAPAAPADPRIKRLETQIKRLEKQIDALQPPTTLVMVELDEPRTTHLMRRGNFLDPGDPVQPGTPQALHASPADAPPNRLGLAQWLVDPQNPLVARVTVNRWWAEIFGHGIVTTLEDFGLQGERPTHPDLLDWLAVEFMESDWSMKHVHRLIVTSAAYQQSSAVTAELLQADPDNRWYARGPRLRLTAEMIRDNALAIAGLLSSTMGGEPIYPPQPEGIWRHVGRNPPQYKTSQGDDRFRRGIYVIWRRSAPYPSFTNFDAPDRAACVFNRPRTNTPLQALTLLNDPAYVELALEMAVQLASAEGPNSIEERLVQAIRRCVAREPQEDELQHLLAVFEREQARLADQPATAREIVGQRTLPEDADAVDVAAWFFITNILLNLDETITKG